MNSAITNLPLQSRGRATHEERRQKAVAVLVAWACLARFVASSLRASLSEFFSMAGECGD